MIFRNIITALLLTMFASCNSQNTSVKSINTSEFEKGIAETDAHLIDVRTPKEYSGKHILRSQNIDVNDVSFETKMNELDKSKPLYLYCLSGSRSKNAGDWAVKNGFTEVYNLDGGINAWMNDKRAVVTESGAAPAKGMSFDDYLGHIKASKKLVLVDFSAVWCGPCKILTPIVHKQVTANQDKVMLLEIDVDKNPLISTTMNIRGIPLLLLYKDGKEVWRSTGLVEESVLAEKIKEFI